jgi:hypothetical protein
VKAPPPQEITSMCILSARPASFKAPAPSSCPNTQRLIADASAARPCRRCTLVLQSRDNPASFVVVVPRCRSRRCVACRPVVAGAWAEHLLGLLRGQTSLWLWEGDAGGLSAACRRATRAGGEYAAVIGEGGRAVLIASAPFGGAGSAGWEAAMERLASALACPDRRRNPVRTSRAWAMRRVPRRAHRAVSVAPADCAAPIADALTAAGAQIGPATPTRNGTAQDAAFPAPVHDPEGSAAVTPDGLRAIVRLCVSQVLFHRASRQRANSCHGVPRPVPRVPPGGVPDAA